MVANVRYYDIERELRDMRDCVIDILAANPKLPRHVRGPLEHRLVTATQAINLQEPVGLKPPANPWPEIRNALRLSLARFENEQERYQDRQGVRCGELTEVIDTVRAALKVAEERQ